MRSLLATVFLLVAIRPEHCTPGGGGTGDAGAPTPCNGPPGLYVEGSCTELAEGVQPYRPRFVLWSDAAEKERFVYLPPGTTIDTTNADRWTFPTGTRFYKTFARDGVRLETRLIEKTGTGVGPTNWRKVSYAWSADQLSVTVAPAAGLQNVLGTTHDIPSQAQCSQCHALSPTMDVANGFEAIQLNHFGPGVTLVSLVATRRLVNGTNPEPNVTIGNARIPGNLRAQHALGYLHANCGHCHGGPTPRANMSLWSVVGTRTVEETAAYTTAICQPLQRWTGHMNAAGEPYTLRIAPGDSAHSGILGRMSARGSRDQMPPVGTEIVDPDGIADVTEWIDSLDCPRDACPMPATP